MVAQDREELRLALLASGGFPAENLSRAISIAQAVLDAARLNQVQVRAVIAVDLSDVQQRLADDIAIEPLDTIAVPGAALEVLSQADTMGGKIPCWRVAVNRSVQESDVIVLVGDDTQMPLANALMRPCILVPSAPSDCCDPEIHGRFGSSSWFHAYRAILPNREAAAIISAPDSNMGELMIERWAIPRRKVMILPVPVLPMQEPSLRSPDPQAPYIDWFITPENESAQILGALESYYGEQCGQLLTRAVSAAALTEVLHDRVGRASAPAGKHEAQWPEEPHVPAGRRHWLKSMVQYSTSGEVFHAPGVVIAADARVTDRFDSLAAWVNRTGAQLVVLDNPVNRSVLTRHSWRVPPVLAADARDWARAVKMSEHALLRRSRPTGPGAHHSTGQHAAAIDSDCWLQTIAGLAGRAYARLGDA